MSTNVIIAPQTPSLVLNFGPFIKTMNDEGFTEFCQLNRDLRIERTREGDLIIMSPTGGEIGRRNFNLTVLFGEWAKRDGTGIGFDSSTGFTLPNGAKRSPDLAWIRRTCWEQLSAAEKEGFPPLCPDFVAELCSRSDDLDALQEKLKEYIANGAQLGWLIDPQEKKEGILHYAATDFRLEPRVQGWNITRRIRLSALRGGLAQHRLQVSSFRCFIRLKSIPARWRTLQRMPFQNLFNL